MGENYTSIFITYNAISFNDYASGKPSLWLYQEDGWVIDTNNQYVQLNSPIIFTQNAILYEWDFLLKTLLPELEIQEREEAYATAIYNTNQDEIQLGLGYITRTEDDKVEFTFGGNENQSVATRSYSIEHDHILKWDNNSKKLVDGGVLPISNIKDGDSSGSLQQKGYVSKDGYTTLGAIASGEGAIAFGGQRFDKVGSPVSEEPQTEAKGKQSFAAGGGVLVNGNWSAGFGKDNIVDGKAAFSVGGGNVVKEVLDNNGNVSYSFSIALGESNEVHGRSSVALGSTNHLEKFGSYAIGYGNKIYGKQSGALGTGNQIDAENATSIGHSNFIHNLHNFSTLIGTGLKSSIKYQTVSGRFNAPSGGVFVVGNGNNDEDRKNAFTVMEDGRAKVYGTPIENNDVVRLGDLNGYVTTDTEQTISGAKTFTNTINADNINIGYSCQLNGRTINLLDSTGMTTSYQSDQILKQTLDQGLLTYSFPEQSGTLMVNVAPTIYTPDSALSTDNSVTFNLTEHPLKEGHLYKIIVDYNMWDFNISSVVEFHTSYDFIYENFMTAFKQNFSIMVGDGGNIVYPNATISASSGMNPDTQIKELVVSFYSGDSSILSFNKDSLVNRVKIVEVR